MIGFLGLIFGIISLFGNTWMLQTGYNITFLKFFPEQLPVLTFYQVMAIYIVIGLIENVSPSDTKVMLDMNSDERDILNLSRGFLTLVKNALILFMTWLVVGLAGL